MISYGPSGSWQCWLQYLAQPNESIELIVTEGTAGSVCWGRFWFYNFEVRNTLFAPPCASWIFLMLGFFLASMLGIIILITIVIHGMLRWTTILSLKLEMAHACWLCKVHRLLMLSSCPKVQGGSGEKIHERPNTVVVLLWLMVPVALKFVAASEDSL